MSEPKLSANQGVGGLKKTKMSTSNIVFMLYCLVAAGAFGIEEMIPCSGPGLTLLLLILFPIFWAAPISMLIAELGSVVPAEGGVYTWTRDTFGEFWGWQMGFWNAMSIWLQQSLYVILIVGYLEKFVPLSPAMDWTIKIIIVVIFSVVNIIGLKEVSWVSTVLSILVIIGFAGVCIVGFCNWNVNPFEPMINEDEGVIGSLGGSICIAIWMFCGYECIANIGDEIENPQIVPKGLLIAMPIIALSYFLPTLAGLGCVGDWENWNVDSGEGVGYVDVFLNNGLAWAAVAFLVVAILSNCSIFNVYIMSGSRQFFAMSDDKLFPPFLCKVSKSRGTPHVAIIIMAIITIVLCKLDFTTLIMATTPLQLYLYMVLAIVIYKMRKVYPVEDRLERGMWIVPGGKAGLWICIVLPFVVSFVALYVNGTEYFITGFVMLLISLICYLVCKWVYGGMYKIDPINYPLNKKTRLAVGDLINIGYYTLFAGVAGFIGSIMLWLYEGSPFVGAWGPEYYLEEYGSGLFSNFDLMLDLCRWGGLALIAAGIILVIIGKKTEGKEYAEVCKRRENKSIDDIRM